MEFFSKEGKSSFQKFIAKEDSKEIGRIFVYLIQNDLHEGATYALIEDMFVEEEYRGKGVASALMEQAISFAKAQKCYKIIMQSRYENTQVHAWYVRLGFTDHGKNFRMNLDEK